MLSNRVAASGKTEAEVLKFGRLNL